MERNRATKKMDFPGWKQLSILQKFVMGVQVLYGLGFFSSVIAIFFKNNIDWSTQTMFWKSLGMGLLEMTGVFFVFKAKKLGFKLLIVAQALCLFTFTSDFWEYRTNTIFDFNFEILLGNSGRLGIHFF